MVSGPQEIRKQNIQQMRKIMEMFGVHGWREYNKLATQFMYVTGASQYKTKEYFEIVLNYCSENFETRKNSNGELEYHYIAYENDVITLKSQKGKLEQELKEVNSNLEKLNATNDEQQKN